MSYRKLKRRVRRESGRIHIVIYHPSEFPWQDYYWDDWIDWRDGFRMKRNRFKSWKHLFKKRKQWMKAKPLIASDKYCYG